MYKLSMSIFGTKHIRDYSDLSRRYNTVPNDLKVYEYHYSELAKLISEVNKEIEIDRKLEISELEAKVYAYEQIISNSNFKVMVEENKTKKKNKKRGKKK